METSTRAKELVAAKEEASRIRKLERKNLKEKLRIYHLETEMQQLMAKAPLAEWKPTTPVFDLKFNFDALYDPSGQPVRVGNPHTLS